MTDLDYRKIYCECFNKNLTYKEYFPVKEYLYKIIGSFKDGMSYELDFTRDLLRVFDLIMQENKYDNLNSYIDFLINLHVPAYEVSDLLEVFIFPEKVYEQKNNYYYCFQELCHSIITRFDEEKFSNFKLDEMAKIYHKYHNSINYSGIYDPNTNKLIYFEKYVPIIMGYFYLSNKPNNYLETLLKEFISNYDDLYVKGVLSGISDKDHFISTLGEKGEYEFFQYVFLEGLNVNTKGMK